MGPFEVVSNGSDRQAKELLNFLEQFRYALASQLGNPELTPTWPVRVLVGGRKTPQYPALGFGRDSWIASASEPGPVLSASLAQILLDAWPGNLPPHLRRGLVSLYSTLQVEGTRVTLGLPPQARDRDWTRAHMLAVHPDYSGKLRVLLGNLGRGVESDIAYRNAFETSSAGIEKAVDAYMTTGQYGTIPAPSRAVTVRQFLGKPLDAVAGQIVTADLLLANGQASARDLYASALKSKPDSVEAQEGLGLIAVKSGQKDEGRKLLAAAQSAAALVEFARLETDPALKRQALLRAAHANPRWAEPHKLLATIETHPAQKLAALRKAAQLESQNPANWVALAIAQEEANQLAEAARSWAAAERSTDDPAERERIRQSRLAGEQHRDEAVRAEREAARRKAEQELEDLRQRALMNIRKAEAKANEGKPVLDARQLDEYKEGPQTKKVSGVLARVDCLGIEARLHIASGRDSTRILVPDPSKVAISGGGELSFGCGVQKPARKVAVEYTPRKDARQGTSGDAVTIEFQ